MAQKVTQLEVLNENGNIIYFSRTSFDALFPQNPGWKVLREITTTVDERAQMRTIQQPHLPAQVKKCGLCGR